MYVPNRYVVELAQRYPDIFLPVISIHPYRSDAVQELEKWAKAGVKYVKWLPNAMGMDPANPVIEPFYKKMKEHNMILLSHAGEEQAVEAEEDQRLGNPLRLRKPLDMGVRVIIAHAASLGSCDDMIRAAQTETVSIYFYGLWTNGNTPDCYSAKYPPCSSSTACPCRLRRSQAARFACTPGKRQRLPVAGDQRLIWTRLLRAPASSPPRREALNDIYDYNPLLFDFVLKRTLRHPETKQKIAPSMFMENPGLEN